MNSDLDLVRMGERLKEKEIRLFRLMRPTAGEAGREERTTAGTHHLFKLSNFISHLITVRMWDGSGQYYDKEKL